MEKKKAYLTYFTGLLLFGSNGVIASFIALSSHRIVLLRSVLGCALMLVLFFATGRRFSFREHKKDLLFVAISGIAMAADWLFLFEAYAQIGVSLGMLINYTGLGCFFYFSSIGKLPAQSVAVCGYIEPLSAVLLSSIVLKERMMPLQFLGAALIIGGALYGELRDSSRT